MSKEDAAVIKVLADLGLRKEEPLTPEQEAILRRVKDDEGQFLDDVERLFSPSLDNPK